MQERYAALVKVHFLTRRNAFFVVGYWVAAIKGDAQSDKTCYHDPFKVESEL
jgi:hypothetical protein